MIANRLSEYLVESKYTIEREDSIAQRFVNRSWLSPIAYLHTIYRPTAPLVVQKISGILRFPEEIDMVYKYMNGASLFSGAIQFFGCVEEGLLLDRANPLSLPPLSIVEMNNMFISKEHGDQFLCIGGYSYDRSLVCIDRNTGEAVCFRGDALTAVRKSWVSVEKWLSDEIQRLGLLFSPDGKQLVDEKYELPDVMTHQ